MGEERHVNYQDATASSLGRAEERWAARKNDGLNVLNATAIGKLT
jgi:hypothetical protein